MLTSPISTDMDPIIPSMEIKTRPKFPGSDEESAHSTGRSRAGAKKLSTDPQSVAARQRRHRISDRFKTLRRLVPGAQKMDTASMLDGAIRYVKFLKAQIRLHHQIAISYGCHHPVSGYTNYPDLDNYNHQCHDRYADMSAASFSGTVEVQPPSSLQLPDHSVSPGSCVVNDQIIMYDG